MRLGRGHPDIPGRLTVLPVRLHHLNDDPAGFPYEWILQKGTWIEWI
jgi:hypothetical protein